EHVDVGAGHERLSGTDQDHGVDVRVRGRACDRLVDGFPHARPKRVYRRVVDGENRDALGRVVLDENGHRRLRKTQPQRTPSAQQHSPRAPRSPRLLSCGLILCRVDYHARRLRPCQPFDKLRTSRASGDSLEPSGVGDATRMKEVPARKQEMNFEYSDKVKDLERRLAAFMNEHVYPNEPVFRQQIAEGDRWRPTPIVEALKDKARAAGLWNLFLPESEYGAGLTNTEYAPLCEIMGRSPGFAPEVFNCSAPDTGNMEVLVRYGTVEQRRRWL